METAKITLLEAATMILVLVVALGFYNALLLKDDRTPEDHPDNRRLEQQWHVVGAVVFGSLAYTFGRFVGWHIVPFVLSCFWTFFAGIVHEFALGKEFFFVGRTAATDRLLRWVARTLHADLETVCATFKIMAVVGSITFLLLLKPPL